jgi:Mg2+/Co2+ transporter CorB
MPGETGVTVVTMLVCSFYFAYEAAGASSARHSLRPLISEGRRFGTKLARMRRDREAVSVHNGLFEVEVGV